MTSVFLDLDALDDDDVDEHMHDYAFVENSDDENLTCRRTHTAEESFLNSDDSYTSDCSEEASYVSENTENTRNVREMSHDSEVDDASEESEDVQTRVM